eukprot:1875292-Rhodomonas_salina.1
MTDDCRFIQRYPFSLKQLHATSLHLVVLIAFVGNWCLQFEKIIYKDVPVEIVKIVEHVGLRPEQRFDCVLLTELCSLPPPH